MRTLVPLIVVAALLASAAGIEMQMRGIPREDPLGRQLLYMPTATYLKLISIGNEGLLADWLFIWSIQYYTQFNANERMLYLDKMFDLITDLDPLYVDPYRIGAIIMLIEAEREPSERRKSVLALLDKGIAAIPDDYFLAEEAAWKCRIFFQDNELAAHYARIASERPNAPHWTKRFYGHLKSESWSLDESIAYWEDVFEGAQTDYQRMVSLNHLYDLKTKRDRQILDPLLKQYAARSGSCPESWQPLIEAGLLRAVPLDPAGNEYGIDPADCSIVAAKQIKEQ